ncbi:MAG: 3-oxoacyl-ACP synthase [Burkholderiaceae bacterium]|nr:MAG: 3-oxoacyl-ACP synthase [Burkholderiaceae bacterium]
MNGFFPLRAWSAWMPGLESRAAWLQHASMPSPEADTDAIPAVKFIDAMTRRRLGRLARLTLQVAYEATCELPVDLPLRLVYASRHGDMRQTINLLSALADDEPLSPTAFGMSVHNAIAGMWSIQRQDRSAASAISAGESTLHSGLLEAVLQWQEQPDQLVLYLYADDAVPLPYALQIPAGIPQALALVIGNPPLQNCRLPGVEQCRDVVSSVQVLGVLR